MYASAPGTIKQNLDETQELEKPSSFLPGHSYTILGVRSIFGLRLVNLRNIWGGYEWDGAWSEKSAFWTKDIREQLKPEESSGTFWMCYDDFVKHFVSLNICKVYNAHEIRAKGKFIRLEDQENGEVSVMSKWNYILEIEKKTTLQLGIH